MEDLTLDCSESLASENLNFWSYMEAKIDSKEYGLSNSLTGMSLEVRTNGESLNDRYLNT